MPLEDDVIPEAPPWDSEPHEHGEQDLAQELIEDAPDIPDEVYDTVPTEPDVMKRGVYHFRAESYEKRMKDGQPNFNIKWVCQQEPYTGRMAWDTVPGVNASDVKIAADTSHPEHEKAVKLLHNRLWKSAQIMKAARYRAPGMNFQKFLDTNPELKIAGDQVPRMKDSGEVKDGKKVYKPDGTKKNWKVKEYLPL